MQGKLGDITSCSCGLVLLSCINSTDINGNWCVKNDPLVEPPELTGVELPSENMMEDAVPRLIYGDPFTEETATLSSQVMSRHIAYLEAGSFRLDWCITVSGQVCLESHYCKDNGKVILVLEPEDHSPKVFVSVTPANVEDLSLLLSVRVWDIVTIQGAFGKNADGYLAVIPKHISVVKKHCANQRIRGSGKKRAAHRERVTAVENVVGEASTAVFKPSSEESATAVNAPQDIDDVAGDPSEETRRNDQSPSDESSYPTGSKEHAEPNAVPHEGEEEEVTQECSTLERRLDRLERRVNTLAALSIPHFRTLAAELLLTIKFPSDPRPFGLEGGYTLRGYEEDFEPVASACHLRAADFIVASDALFDDMNRSTRAWADLPAAAKEAQQQMREWFPASQRETTDLALLRGIIDWAAAWEAHPLAVREAQFAATIDDEEL